MELTLLPARCETEGVQQDFRDWSHAAGFQSGICCFAAPVRCLLREVEGCFCSLFYLSNVAALGEKQHKEGKFFHLLVVFFLPKLIAEEKKKRK